MSSKGSLARHHEEKSRWLVMFHPEIAVLSMDYDHNLDVVVTFLCNGRRSKSRVCTDSYCNRYFLVARQRIYFSDLRKVPA